MFSIIFVSFLIFPLQSSEANSAKLYYKGLSMTGAGWQRLQNKYAQ